MAPLFVGSDLPLPCTSRQALIAQPPLLLTTQIQAAKRMAETARKLNVTSRATATVIAPTLWADPRNASAPKRVTGFCSLVWTWDSVVATAALPSFVRRVDIVLSSWSGGERNRGAETTFTLSVGSGQPPRNVGYGTRCMLGGFLPPAGICSRQCDGSLPLQSVTRRTM